MPTKLAKKLPKRAGSSRRKDYRANAWKRGETRKAERVAAQEKRHQENVSAGKEPKRRIRPRAQNMRMCVRCRKRMIVAGSVCICRAINDSAGGKA